VTTDTTSRINWDSDLCTQCDICLSVCPRQSSPKTRQYSVEQILTLIHHQRHFINGITVSGGDHRVFQSLELLAQHAKLYEVRLLHIPASATSTLR
jgi:pyruvate-formate lyase-activating enzyme